jgi:HEPN domain-containing protein
MNSSDGWIRQVHYDLDTARAMFDSGRYLYVLFCCQQAVEKMLKAVISVRTNTFPPRIHALIRLAEAATVDLDEKRTQFLRELSNYYIQTRYPEEIPAMAERISEEQAGRILRKTEEMIQWLNSMI